LNQLIGTRRYVHPRDRAGSGGFAVTRHVSHRGTIRHGFSAAEDAIKSVQTNARGATLKDKAGQRRVTLRSVRCVREQLVDLTT
jgi:hypothetical protein